MPLWFKKKNNNYLFDHCLQQLAQNFYIPYNLLNDKGNNTEFYL